MNFFERLILSIDLALGISELTPTVRNVTIVFLCMLVALVLFFFTTLGTLLGHQWFRLRSEKRKKYFSNETITWMLDPTLPMPNPDVMDRQDLREAILDLVLITRGHERTILLRLYKVRGFWDRDVDELKSPYWHIRLSALVRIDQWQASPDFELLTPLIDDNNFQIQQIAMKNASRTKESEIAQQLLDRLTRINPHHSVTYECLMRMLRLHREEIQQSLELETRRKLWPFILTVLGDARDISGVPLLLKFTQVEYPIELQLKALCSLGKIGDPRGIPALQKALTSPAASLRLAALKALVSIDPNYVLPLRETLLVDTDSLVKSWTRHLLRGPM